MEGKNLCIKQIKKILNNIIREKTGLSDTPEVITKTTWKWTDDE